MAKVLLIQPHYNRDLNRKLTPWMPLALVELASFIEEKGHKPKILDRNLYKEDINLLNVLKRFQPDIVGMTAYTGPLIKDIIHISKIVKENSSALVVVGGIHASLEPKSLLDVKFIDYIVRGEGEETLLEMCESIDKNKKDFSKLKNVNYNPLRPLINLNDLPVTNYDLIDVKKYPVATFTTSRGCPGRCKFCYNKGRAIRFYNTEKVIKTVERTIEKYHIKEFTIADDNFANLSVRTTKICHALSKYNAIFHIFLRVDQTQDKVMKDLKHAGCWAIQFGFESGSQRMLDFIQKDTTVKQNIEAVKQCKKYGIFVDGSFMIGLPTETISDLRQTTGFIEKYKPDAVNIKIYKPFPSTELYDYAINEGLMKAPKSIKEWIEFSNLQEGNLNLSQIPTPLLERTIKKFNGSSNPVYVKKAIRLIFGGHMDYVLYKTRETIKSKLKKESFAFYDEKN